ncbi:taurine--2-oxoglutarate transaminase [Sinobacterium caligoides]|uniref:Taurine--2-oxoglutarate transaminase n=1 Tax=Sinobacterium caligoides TaxID=933926 RepID=A0A3N2E1T0_9GAMM|nr:aminotransferase class III-fold pyridoxal phosphate-dependent enzyme [Sinobacterium caligoides]ROS05525.1 taurine--2-oxoglutarate transaminase [Sinobacterium caligoides]
MSDSILTNDKKFVFRSWTEQNKANPMIIAGGNGAYFWDDKGNKYLDFSSQRINLNLGHQHPKMIEAMKTQLDSLTTCAQIFSTEPRTNAAKLIADRTPGDLNKVFFTNAGSDAVEHAVRIAKISTGRSKVLTMHKSYHGATAGSLSLTGDQRRWFSEPGIPGVVRFFGPHLYRSAFHSKNEQEECERAIEHLEEIIKYENPKHIAAILIESIVGSNGVLVPPSGYLQKIRDICDKHGIVMICDEVMSGFGRTGYWFAVDFWDVCPDIITFAKGVNSGYVPLGGVAISEKIAGHFDDEYFPGGGTYYGHPLACSTAVASINIFESDNLLSKVRLDGEEVVYPKLQDIKNNHQCVGEIRGLGLFWVLELVKNRETKEPVVAYGLKKSASCPISEFTKECMRKGVSVLTSGNYLFICPPLIIERHDLLKGLDIIDKVLFGIDFTK